MDAVAIYARISDDKTGEQIGVEAQVAECQELAAAEGLTVVGTPYLDPSLSAYQGGARPGYRGLLAAVRSGRIQGVLVWSADRLHRDPTEAEAFMKLCRKHGVTKIYTAAGDVFNIATAEGMKNFGYAAVAARFESQRRGERVVVARKRQAAQGKFGGGSRRPYGFGVPVMERDVWDRKTKTYVVQKLGEPQLDYTRVVEEEAEEIRRWARKLLSGVSMAHILADLKEREVPTVTGRPWSSAAVKGILTNPRVSGSTHHGGEIVKRDAWQSILAEEQRLALVEMFKDPARRNSPGNTPRWLGSLLYRCGVCDNGAAMFVRRQPNGTPVYCCREKFHCKRPVELVDGLVELVAISRLSEPDTVDMFARPHTSPDVDVVALRDEQQALRQRQDDLATDYADGRLSRSQLHAGTERIDVRLHDIAELLAASTQESPLSPLVGVEDVADAGMTCRSASVDPSCGWSWT
jgi:DNA invertase Pin-like site-specific DNA recombinase